MFNIKVLMSNNYVDKTSVKRLMASPLYVIISRLRTFIPDNAFIKNIWLLFPFVSIYQTQINMARPKG